MLVCGDDADAKAVVMKLIEDLGVRALDAGPLTMASVLEGLTAVMVRLNNADFLTLALIGGGVVLVGYFIFKS